MCKKTIWLISLALALGLASSSYGDRIIGDWEQSMDNWVIDPEVPGVDVRYSDSNGVTLGNYSLDVYVPVGEYKKVLMYDVLANGLLDDFRSNQKISLDVTRLAADWPGAADWVGGGIHMVINAGGDGWSIWEGTYEGWWSWSAGDETTTLTWNYSEYFPRMNFDSVWWLQLFFISNFDMDYDSGVYYLDNCRLWGSDMATNPQPPTGARDVSIDTVLSWDPADAATSHNVYFGTTFDSVNDANLASDPNVIFTTVDQASFDPNGLEFKTRYFWRVDEVSETNPDNPQKGSIWNFTTADFVIVDDFESYNDINPGEPGSNRIMESWIDGFGIETNGALVGHDFPPYAEQTTVHNGAQSMPLYYNNTGAALQSEVQRVWAEPQDWTSILSGSIALKLYTHGIGQNTPGQMYTILEDNVGISYQVSNPDSALFTAEEWKEWEFSLNEFAAAGVDLTSVKKLVIGIANLPGQAEASGILYVDDIRRYPPVVVSLEPDHVVVPKTSVAPVIDGVWDAIWNDVNETQCLITDMVDTDSATPEDVNDLSARFKVMFDDNNFYIFVEVLDSVIDMTHNDEWMNDGIEAYFDGDYSHGDAYDGVNDNQIRITVDDVALADTNSSLAIDGTVFKVLRTSGGYNIEAAFPLDVLQIYPSQDPEPAFDADGNIIPGTGIAPNNVIGFEVQINDNDGGGRQTIMRWHSDDNNSYQDPSLFGQARLVSN